MPIWLCHSLISLLFFAFTSIRMPECVQPLPMRQCIGRLFSRLCWSDRRIKTHYTTHSWTQAIGDLPAYCSCLQYRNLRFIDYTFADMEFGNGLGAFGNGWGVRSFSFLRFCFMHICFPFSRIRSPSARCIHSCFVHPPSSFIAHYSFVFIFSFCAMSVPQYPSEFHSQSFFVGHQSFSIILLCIHASLFRMQNTWAWHVNTRHPGSLREEGVL
jgi:hypothetical protein